MQQGQTLQAPAHRGYVPIGDYAAIGDGRSLVLIARDGSIDWLCLPELDSPSVFGALLDPARGGRFVLAPAVPFESRRRYVEQTNVLETTFETADGSVRVTDSVNRAAGESAPGREVARRIEGLSGAVPLVWRVEPRFDYGRDVPSVARADRWFVVDSAGKERLAVQSWNAGEPEIEDAGLGASFELAGGDSALISLLGVDGEPLLASRREAVERRMEATVEYWCRWVGRARYDGRWSDAVRRSLLAIGLLTDDRTGAIAAAGTTSLPEALGRRRNYDYRYAWARDLSFTLDALLRIGLEDLAHKSFMWMLKATRHTHPRIDPVYRLVGVPLHGQESLPLPGWRGTGPVHVGNRAATQLQLGGFGDFLETAWMYTRQGGMLDPESGERLADIADLLTRLWRNDDAGLWELDENAQYLTSKLACWAAFDRIVRLADAGQVPSRHVARWCDARDEVARYVEQRLWSPRRRSYVQKEGSDTLDAACLLSARRGMMDPRGERMNQTIDAIRDELGAGGPLLYRYSGMRDAENAFVACSFWAVEALAAARRFDEAAETMDAMVALATDVGLYAEEIDPATHAMRGNMPQALSHLALINAAVIFEESLAEATG